MSSNYELEEFNGLGPALAPRIPNAENRELESKVELKQRRVQSIQGDLDENVTKIHMLEDHLKNVQDELATTLVKSTEIFFYFIRGKTTFILEIVQCT